MKYFLEIFLIIGIAVAFVASAVVADVNPSWTHTSTALNILGSGWIFLLAIFVMLKFLHGGYSEYSKEHEL